MRRAALGAILAIAFVTQSGATEQRLVGRSFNAGPNGQPFCVEQEDLKEYLMAMVTKNDLWLRQLKGCGMLKKGVQFVVIDEYESDSDALGHVLKVRAMNERGSGVGYTLSLGVE